MRISHTKVKLFLSILAVIFSGIVLITAIFNAFLFKSEKTLIQPTDKYFTQKISVGSVLYVPPDSILLKNITLTEALPGTGKHILRIPAVTAKFSLPELLIKGRIFISSIYFRRADIDYGKFRVFLKDNFSGIVAFIKSLPMQDIKLFFKEAKFRLDSENNKQKYVSVDSVLAITGDDIYGFGTFDSVRESKRDLPLRYRFKGFCVRGGFSFENLELMRDDLYVKLWGGIHGSAVRANGFAFIDTSFDRDAYGKPFSKIKRQIKLFMKKPFDNQFEEVPGADLHIHDIDWQFNLALPQVKIERMDLSLNNIPFKIKGDVAILEDMPLDLMLSAWLLYFRKNWIKDVEKADVKITGFLSKNELRGDADLSLSFIKDHGVTLQKAEMIFKDSRLNFSEYPRLNVFVKALDVSYIEKENTHRVFLHDFNADLNLQDKRYKFIDFNSRLYDGIFSGKACLDMVKSPPRVGSSMQIKDVSANRLGGLFFYLSKVDGKLQSDMRFDNYPRATLSGRMFIQSGYLTNFDFFKWMGNIFNLPELEKVYFDNIDTDFLTTFEKQGLDKINLVSDDLNLNGYFGLDKNEIVSSKISIIFSRRLMEKSANLQTLLNLVDEKSDRLAFDFQLSGNFHKMNFQWLESEFKKKIQKAIPDFIERKIEKNIEDFIESVK